MPAPGSAVVTGEQPGTGRAEASLPCRAWCGVAAVPQDGCTDPHCSPDSPVGHTSPLGTATPSAPRAPRHHGPGHTRHHSVALPCGNAAASPPTGTMRLAPDPSAAGHGGCGEDLPLPPLFTIFSHPLCPTLVLGAAQLCASATAARLPAAAVSVIPAPHALLPGWCGRRGPCEAAGLLLHVGPGMPTGTGMHLSPPSVLGAHPAPLHTLLPWPSLGQQLRRQRGTAWHRPSRGTHLLPRCGTQGCTGAGSMSPGAGSPRLHGSSSPGAALQCRQQWGWGSVCPARAKGSQLECGAARHREPRGGQGAGPHSPSLPLHRGPRPLGSQHRSEAQPWVPGVGRAVEAPGQLPPTSPWLCAWHSWLHRW